MPYPTPIHSPHSTCPAEDKNPEQFCPGYSTLEPEGAYEVITCLNDENKRHFSHQPQSSFQPYSRQSLPSLQLDQRLHLPSPIASQPAGQAHPPVGVSPSVFGRSDGKSIPSRLLKQEPPILPALQHTRYLGRYLCVIPRGSKRYSSSPCCGDLHQRPIHLRKAWQLGGKVHDMQPFYSPTHTSNKGPLFTISFCCTCHVFLSILESAVPDACNP
jgi:hypothetical protein